MPDGQYQHTTAQVLVDQLAQDLGDASGTFFLDAELLLAVNESLRVWNLLTAFERTVIRFPTSEGVAWYDLTAEAPDELSLTVTDREVVTAVQYRLMEQIDPGTGTGMTEQFTLPEIVRVLQQTRDRFLSETSSTITRGSESVITVGTQRHLLPDTTIRVLRAGWRTLDDTHHPLRGATDEYLLSAIPRRAAPIPRAYSVAGTPNLALDLYPSPTDTGYLRLFTIESGPTLDTTANTDTGTVLGVHDDLCWGLGWGVVEALCLKNGVAKSPARAEFAKLMYGLARESALNLPLILDIAVDTTPIRTSSIRVMDAVDYGWEGRTRGRPRKVGVLGDWLGLSPVPDQAYEVSVTLVRRALQPALASYLSLGREQLSAILGWAKQLALFKVGGAPLQLGVSSATRLVEQARTYNEQRISQSPYLLEMLSRGTDASPPLPRAARPDVELADPRDTASSRSSRSSNLSYNPGRPRLGGR